LTKNNKWSDAQSNRKTVILLALFLVFSIGSHPGAAHAGEITLENGAKLKVVHIQYSRVLPHSFYDQALASLPHLFPEHLILAARRSGKLGDAVYALVCYRETPTSQNVTIQAVVSHGVRAWRLETTSADSYSDMLIQVLEQIAKLPSNGAAQRSRRKSSSPLSPSGGRY